MLAHYGGQSGACDKVLVPYVIMVTHHIKIFDAPLAPVIASFLLFLLYTVYDTYRLYS